jgi:transposase
MPYITTSDERSQLFMISLEGTVSQDSFVRVIDAFVDAIDFKSFGITHTECKEEGRPAYHPSVLMKLYLYGYQYGIRSSRKLERECRLNLECLWLTSCRYPRYKTIADFRKNNAQAFRSVFRSFVHLLKEIDLVDGRTIAIDSFKIRAQNSLKNNFNEKNIDRHLEYIDNKILEYESQLDNSELEEEKEVLQTKINQQEQRRNRYQEVRERLKESGEEQLSLTDPDSRAVILHRNIVNVGYNVQAAIDSTNKLLVEYDTGDVNDTRALSKMAIKTKELIRVNKMDLLADKGYHTGEELRRCEEENITTYVSPKAPSTRDTGLYPISIFKYNKEADTYTCPEGIELTTNNVWYQHSGDGKNAPYSFRRFITSECKGCTNREKCTNSKHNGRAIDRSEYADAIEQNNYRVVKNPEYYRQRQQLAEHPFGTLKRQRGFTFTLIKGKEKVLGEVGLEFICYNLTRCTTILGVAIIIKALKELCCQCFSSLYGLFSAPLTSLQKIHRNSPETIKLNYCLLMVCK